MLKITPENYVRIESEKKFSYADLFSDGQNMYKRVVLVCTVNVYITWAEGQFSGTKY